MTATHMELDEMLDSELLESYELDFEISCDSEQGCSKKPVWRVLTKCCGHQLLLCDEHFWSFFERNNKILLDDEWALTCGYCNTDLDFVTKLSDWIEATKI